MQNVKIRINNETNGTEQSLILFDARRYVADLSHITPAEKRAICAIVSESDSVYLLEPWYVSHIEVAEDEGHFLKCEE